VNYAPSSTLIELGYTSSAQRLFTPQDLEDIFTVSRRKNRAAGITGLLLYKSGSILQVLEGEPAAVYALLTILRDDSRHCQLHVIFERAVAGRQFPDWSIGFQSWEAPALAGEGVFRVDALPPYPALGPRTRTVIDAFVATVR
jgi:FAD-dependent sensor of blue light